MSKGVLRMERQQNFTDIEYSNRRHRTKREAFLEKMDAILPWREWAALVTPYYSEGKRGRKLVEIDTDIQLKHLIYRIEGFNMKIIMRRDCMIFSKSRNWLRQRRNLSDSIF